MGFFSDIVKNVFTDEVRNDASKAAGELDKAFANAGDEISKAFGGSVSSNNRNNYSIPEEYKDFPVLSGTITDLTTKKMDRYQRCSITYYPVKSDVVNEYIDRIQKEGYIKATNVRYEKNNTYIIVDEISNEELNIVYHIKF